MEEAGLKMDTKRNLNAELAEIRNRIDELDGAISALLCQRLLLARQVAEAKKASRAPVYDGSREDEVLENVCAVAPDPQTRTAMSDIYKSVMQASRAIQDQHMASLSSSPQYFPEVCIVGLGLIGGALARHIKSLIPSTRITAVDSQDVLDQALEEKVIDAASTDPVTGIKKASLVILAAHPEQNLRILREISPKLRRRQVVLDVGSVKQPLCQEAESLNLKADFIGGHPLMGNERKGYANSASVNCMGTTFCLSPTQRTTELGLTRLRRWLADLGLNVVVTDSVTHDAALARTSHIVQLMAIAVGNEIAALDSATASVAGSLSGPALRQMSRLMASPSDLWTDILLQNKQQVCSALIGTQSTIARMREALESEDKSAIKELFARSAKVHRWLNGSSGNQ